MRSCREPHSPGIRTLEPGSRCLWRKTPVAWEELARRTPKCLASEDVEENLHPSWCFHSIFRYADRLSFQQGLRQFSSKIVHNEPREPKFRSRDRYFVTASRRDSSFHGTSFQKNQVSFSGTAARQSSTCIWHRACSIVRRVMDKCSGLSELVYLSTSLGTKRKKP